MSQNETGYVAAVRFPGLGGRSSIAWIYLTTNPRWSQLKIIPVNLDSDRAAPSGGDHLQRSERGVIRSRSHYLNNRDLRHLVKCTLTRSVGDEADERVHADHLTIKSVASQTHLQEIPIAMTYLPPGRPNPRRDEGPAEARPSSLSVRLV